MYITNVLLYQLKTNLKKTMQDKFCVGVINCNDSKMIDKDKSFKFFQKFGFIQIKG